MKPAEIVSASRWHEFLGADLKGKTVVATSGGFDPIHPGHLSSFLEARALGDVLVVIVNGDKFLRRKKGSPFMGLEIRSRIVAYAKGVDYVYPFEPTDDEDDTVSEALFELRPDIFAKGGDRDATNIPERSICESLGIRIVSGVGDAKAFSSSGFLRRWDEREKPCGQ